MATDPVSETDRGYLSNESKRRFTLVAGVLGAVFFLLQFALPMAVAFLFLMPGMMAQDFKNLELERGAVWRDELWVVERTFRPNLRRFDDSSATLALSRVRLSDLEPAGPALPLEAVSPDWSPTLLAIGERLWLIGRKEIGYHEAGSTTWLSGASPPTRAMPPFAYGGRPAVITLGSPAKLSVLETEGAEPRWDARELSLDLPGESGQLRALQAVEGGGALFLFAQLCTAEPDRCSLQYRELESEEWLPLLDDVCSCASWSAVALASRPAVVASEREKGLPNRTTIVSVTAAGPLVKRIEADMPGAGSIRVQPFAWGSRILLLAEGMAGSLRLVEVEDGRATRSVRKAGSSPFGPNMIVFMTVPHLLPIVLSLLLAFLLTVQMRQHRVQDYVFEGERRVFASLWQRALAQLADVVPFAAGFLVPMAWTWRMFTDPEQFFASGQFSPFVLAGVFLVSLAWSLLVVVVFSYLEGRFGKTPGKWIVGIRVLGTDLKPCGFWRALLRNVLMFVDGFFSFLVGAMLVALTEKWQRLGDLAARTIVVVDEKPLQA